MKKTNRKPGNKLSLPAKFKTKPYIAAVVVTAVLALGATVYAANGAKPGDVLYSIDKTSEKVQSLLAYSPERKADLVLALASERVLETQAVLEATDFKTADLTAALNGLAAQRKALADLIVAEAELKQQAKAYEDEFEKRENNLDLTFKEAKSRLKAQEKELKTQLSQAEATNNADGVSRITAALAALEARMDALEAEKETAEEALEAEEERLEVELEASEKALEAEEEAREKEIERLEEAAEAARERAEAANEAEKEGLEKEAEQAEAAAEQAREAAENENEELEPSESQDR